MLKQRVITAVLLLPLVGFILFGLNLNGFAITLLIVNYLLAWEWARLSSIEQSPLKSLYALSVSLVSLVIWYYAPAIELWPSTWFIEWHWTSTLLAFWLAIVGWGIAFTMLLLASTTREFWSRTPWFRLLLGLILIVGFWVSVIALRNTDINQNPLTGGFYVLFMFTLVWGADVGGYVFGKLFGKHKLIPSVSPGKTWEGFFGGVFLTLVVAVVGAYLLQLPVNNIGLFVLAIIAIAIISVLGDLFVSLLKRQVNVKDTSQLLPGHGGILDRLDSTIAVSPFFLLFAKALGWM